MEPKQLKAIYSRCFKCFRSQVTHMFGNNKKERLGMLLATIIFAVIGIVQFVRAFSGMPMDFNGQAVPIWASLIVGGIALGMAAWMGTIFRRHRPLL